VEKKKHLAYLKYLKDLGENDMKLVVGNQKSYLDKDGVNAFIKKLGNIKSENVIICPSSIYLSEFVDIDVLIGSQNVSNYDSGATTGELSSKQLKSIGVKFTIVGHSERRQKLNESIEDTNIKIKNLLDEDIIPILCVGETKEEKEQNKTKDILFDEIDGAFKDLLMNSIGKIIIAYEPIWSIGTGLTPTNEEINDIAKSIREHITDNYNTDNLILYGGSVSASNIDELNKIDLVDGYLIGGASTKGDEFLQIIDKCK